MTDERAESIYNSLQEPYDNVYDNVKALRKPAERLVEYAKLVPGQRVLDVACGTGFSTMPAAEVVGNTGGVIGIDISERYLDVARKKAASAGLSNIEYRVGNAEALEYDDASFDAVICALAIFFFKDIPRALREWHRVLKSGGTVAFSSFGARIWQPAWKPLGERLSRYDGQAPPTLFSILEPTNTPGKCRELLEHAGFEEIEVTTEQLDCRYPDTEAYWQDITLTAARFRLARYSPADVVKFKTEHLSEIESMYAGRDILLEFPTHISVAKKR